MLNPASHFRVDEVPGVDVYADHAAPGRFYAIPTKPRVALDDAGRPQISLLLYGRGQGPSWQPAGGQVLLTTTLGLTADEQRRLRAALAQRLANQAIASGPGGPAGRAAVPDAAGLEISSPDWQAGEVKATLVDGVELAGRPSLGSANECAMMATLAADSALRLRQAWNDGLREARIAYRLQVVASETSTLATQAGGLGSVDVPGLDSRWARRVAVQSTVTSAIPYELTIEGPLGMSVEDLRQRVQMLAI
jgi:hypothetical protein